MTLLAIGVNHKTAPVDIRERVAFGPTIVESALLGLKREGVAHEVAILSTCNRTEIYCGVDDGMEEQLIEWVSHFHRLTPEDVRPYIYRYPERDAVRHMLRVASGLDSMVLGEPQILGQMKQAFATASTAGTIGQLLNRLFQHTFTVAKQVRTDTAIGASPVSVAFAAVTLSRRFFASLNRQTALLIGAGETIELVARHLHENGIGRIIIANRTLERAHTLAVEFSGYAIGLDEIPNHLAEADMVIASTASPTPILGRSIVESALRQRKRRPIFMVDIAVPRDIDPEVAALEDVYLYTVDDLQTIIQEGLASRHEAAKQAEEIIDTQVSHFMGWLKSLEAVPLIRALRQRGESLRDAATEHAMRRLHAGHNAEEVVRELAHQLANRMMHTPCEQIRRASSDGRSDLLEAVQKLYQLGHFNQEQRQ
jgi:glutamyl-tRNA reductase